MLPIYPRKVKAETKSQFVTYEVDFWGSLALAHESVSGHIRIFLQVDRKIVKTAPKSLADSKKEQTASIGLISGFAF